MILYSNYKDFKSRISGMDIYIDIHNYVNACISYSDLILFLSGQLIIFVITTFTTPILGWTGWSKRFIILFWSRRVAGFSTTSRRIIFDKILCLLSSNRLDSRTLFKRERKL